MTAKFDHCSIIDNDCASGKTFHVLSLCAMWIQKKTYNGIVYACRTIELIDEIRKRAITNHNINPDDVIIIHGDGSAGLLQKVMRDDRNKLIITTHDAIIHLSHTRKKGFILIHDEKPSDSNIITIDDNIRSMIQKCPEIKPLIKPINPGIEYRNKRYFFDIAEKYHQIVLKSRYKSLKLLSKLLKNGENERFFDIIFFIKNLLIGNVEYYIEKISFPHLFDEYVDAPVNMVKLINYNPYNGWEHVYFIFSHSTLDDKHELSFMRKLRLFDVDYNYYNRWGNEHKFAYRFDNIELHTTNTTRNWSKTYYTKCERFDKALDIIAGKVGSDDKVLVLCNKGYEGKILEKIPDAVILDHAPYGKEKEEYLKCNVIVDISAKYRSIHSMRMLSDFGFDAKVSLWDKTDDIIQYLMRSRARFNQHDNLKLFVLNSKTAELLSSVLGIRVEYDIHVDDDSKVIAVDDNIVQQSIAQIDIDKYYITVYDNTREMTGELFCYDNFRDVLKKIPMDHHKNSGCYLLGKSVNGGRKKSDIECLSFLVFDFDNQSKRLQTEYNVVKQIQGIFPADTLFFIQRTFHPGNYRVLVPLAKGIDTRRYEHIMGYLISKLRNIDESCKRASQIYFSPKHDFREYGRNILNVDIMIPKTPSVRNRKTKLVKASKSNMKNIDMAMLMINAVPKKVRKSNDYCVKLVSGMKKLIGSNNIENSEIWGMLFEKMRVLLEHEGTARINDFIKMSYH